MRQDARRIGRKTEGSRSTSTTCNVTGGRGRRLDRRDERRTQRYPKGDRLKQLRAFCRSARLGSISRAAERLRLSQPSVSLQVSALEEELGLSLFDRRGRSLLLTHVGERLYHLALPLVHGMDSFPRHLCRAAPWRLRRQSSHRSRGPLRRSPAAPIPPVLSAAVSRSARRSTNRQRPGEAALASRIRDRSRDHGDGQSRGPGSAFIRSWCPGRCSSLPRTTRWSGVLR